MLECAVQVMRWRDTRAHRPAICTRNRCTHCVQSVSNRSWPKPQLNLDRSLSHMYIHVLMYMYVCMCMYMYMYMCVCVLNAVRWPCSVWWWPVIRTRTVWQYHHRHSVPHCVPIVTDIVAVIAIMIDDTNIHHMTVPLSHYPLLLVHVLVFKHGNEHSLIVCSFCRSLHIPTPMRKCFTGASVDVNIRVVFCSPLIHTWTLGGAKGGFILW